MGDELTHVIFELEVVDGWPPVGSERVWAYPLGDDVYKVASVPWFVRGVAEGDVVRAVETEQDEWPVYVETIDPSGYCTVRMIPKLDGPLGDDQTAVLDTFIPLGATGEGAGMYPIVATSIAPDLALPRGDLPIEELAQYLAQLPRRSVVAIDGGGGSGKSTLATALASRVSCAVVCTDDFASHDCPTDWWPDLLDQVLKPWVDGRDAVYAPYNWAERKRQGTVMVTHHSPLLLIEGVGSNRREFEPYITVAFWIEVEQSQRLQRGLARDLAYVESFGGQAALEEFWAGWQQAEQRYVDQHEPDRRARFRIDGARGKPGQSVYVIGPSGVV